MAMGPRLEFRQTQSLVMTPQLRQAIKLLQFTNLEVAAFVEQELERNPLLERDERSDAIPELPAPDQRTGPEAELDAATLLRQEKLPDAVEADHTTATTRAAPRTGSCRCVEPPRGATARGRARDRRRGRGAAQPARRIWASSCG